MKKINGDLWVDESKNGEKWWDQNIRIGTAVKVNNITVAATENALIC